MERFNKIGGILDIIIAAMDLLSPGLLYVYILADMDNMLGFFLLVNTGVAIFHLVAFIKALDIKALDIKAKYLGHLLGMIGGFLYGVLGALMFVPSCILFTLAAVFNLKKN